LDKDGIKKAPATGGVFEILRTTAYHRYKGETRVLNIGQSKNMRKEINRRRMIHTTARRTKKIKLEYNVPFRYAKNNAPKKLENKLLKEFEDSHHDLPVLDSQRGYKRNED